mgnify:CR=1 FL=1
MTAFIIGLVILILSSILTGIAIGFSIDWEDRMKEEWGNLW